MPIDSDHLPAQSHWSEPSSGASALVAVSVAGVLAVVAAVVVVNATDDWWTLVPAMLIALVATACVLGIAVRMLGND